MEIRFIVDATAGKLANWLRMLGYDTAVCSGTDPHRLIQTAQREKRIILTRNRKLERKLFLGNIIILKEDQPELQALAVLRSLRLRVDSGNLFSRCLVCNTHLTRTPHADVEGRVPEFVFHSHRVFHRCPSCHRIYWEGSHLRNMKERIEELAGLAKNPP